MNYYRRYDTFDIISFFLIFFVCIFCVISVIVNVHRAISKGTNMRKEIAIVTDKEVKRVNKNEKDKYLVFCKTEKNETVVYEITDSWIAGRFDSANLYGSIEVGKKYMFTVAGSRNTFMSWYPNIYEAEEIQ